MVHSGSIAKAVGYQALSTTNQELFFPRQMLDLSLLRKSAAVMIQIMQSDTPNGFPFPSAWTTTGCVVCAVSALFVGRIVYEETILTWTNGPQMTGFALAH